MNTTDTTDIKDIRKPLPISRSRIICGDVVRELRKLPIAQPFDMVIADPPYNIGKDFGTTQDNMPLPDYVKWTRRWLNACMRLLREDGLIYVYGLPEILAHIAVHYPIDQQRWLVWHYTNKTVPASRFWQRAHESILCLWKERGRPPPLAIDQIREPYTDTYLNNAAGRTRAATPSRFGGTRGQVTTYGAHAGGALPRDVIKIPALAGGAGASERWFLCRTCGDTVYPPSDLAAHRGHDIVKHPTQKPMQLTRRLLQSRLNGTGGRVLIPFAGSGSECVVAADLGLHYIGIEINPEYRDFGDFWLKKERRTTKMYKLTPRMQQSLKQDLKTYHKLFHAGRCAAWELEELIVRAINADTQAQHQVFWREAGHDDKEDIVIKTEQGTYSIQIKSGQWSKKYVTLSGHRLGRFNGDLHKMTHYLNRGVAANIISIPYQKIDNEQGRTHVYEICYIPIEHLQGLDAQAWDKNGTQYEQTTAQGVVCSLRPKMSWQIWWKIPIALVERTREIRIE